MRRVWALAAAVLIPALGAGCSDPPDGLDRQAISGTVQLDGKPLAKGTLLFDPVPGGPGTAVGAQVVDGRFTVPRRQGPSPGDYKVRVYASSGVMASGPPGSSSRSPQPMIERIPPRYNTETTLTATVSNLRENDFEFLLQSAPNAPAR